MTAQQAISARILALVAAGLPLPEAIDAVLGVGTFASVAADVWAALRQKAH